MIVILHALGTFVAIPILAGCTINTSGYDFQKGQPYTDRGKARRVDLVGATGNEFVIGLNDDLGIPNVRKLCCGVSPVFDASVLHLS